MSAVSARGVERVFTLGGEHVVALAGVDLDVAAGEFVIVTGESGSGKTTLLSLLGALDRPTRGDVQLGGRSLAGAPPEELTRLRRELVGFVFQDFLLVRHLSAVENVRLPALLGDGSREPERPLELLERVGMAHRARHLPDALSRGEMQRVAIARALVNRPRLVLADEPTANLDRRNAAAVRDLLAEIHREDGVAVVVATHDAGSAPAGARLIRLEDGRIVCDAST